MLYGGRNGSPCLRNALVLVVRIVRHDRLQILLKDGMATMVFLGRAVLLVELLSISIKGVGVVKIIFCHRHILLRLLDFAAPDDKGRSGPSGNDHSNDFHRTHDNRRCTDFADLSERGFVVAASTAVSLIDSKKNEPKRTTA